MDDRFPAEEIRRFAVRTNSKIRDHAVEVLRETDEQYTQSEISYDEEGEMDTTFGPVHGTYIIAKICPIDSHVCASIPDGLESEACSFYNGFEEKCVFPRVCAHNQYSPHSVGFGMEGPDLERYGWIARRLIAPKLVELALTDDPEDWYDGWAYAEFDDDGETVTLAELVTDQEISDVLRQRDEERQAQVAEKRQAALAELEGIAQEYSLDLGHILDLARLAGYKR